METKPIDKVDKIPLVSNAVLLSVLSVVIGITVAQLLNAGIVMLGVTIIFVFIAFQAFTNK